ncbi:MULTISPECIES: TetR/AcrR family transcriptional regulator [Synechococcales]|uniref:TetR/AcrR family transcriptional regulator n=1 Tax=Synechococcus sp. CS-1324 TaxID=2847980 RepID=UPI00223A911C|nr:TetR/AcrR family transcriptional regulator [Synechococcus sp. CS-1324]
MTKVEQTQRTRRAILDRARLLFAQNGYAATGTEELIRGLGITRGALYHQFKDKQGVLEAVIGEVYEEITGAIRARVEPLETSWDQILMGCHACLDIAIQEDLRRLVFIEAPAFLSVDTLAKLDKPGFTLLQEAIQNAVDEGLLETVNVEGFTYLLNGSLNALASWAAQSSDSDRLRIAHDLLEVQIQLYRS